MVLKISDGTLGLRILRFLCYDLFQLKLVKILLTLIFIEYCLVQLMQCYLFLQHFEAEYFIKYLPIFLGINCDVVCIFTILKTLDIQNVAIHEFKQWKFEETNEKLREKIIRELNIFTTAILIIIVVCSICAVSYSIPYEDDKELFYIYGTCEHFFPTCYKELAILFQLQMIFAVYILAAPFCIICYHFWMFKFQIELFLERIERINEYEGVEENLYECEVFQNVVKERLIFCVKRHSELNWFATKINQNMKLPISLFVVVGVSLLISVAFFLLSASASQITFSDQICRLTTVVLCFGSITLLTPYSGQMVEDESRKIFDNLQILNWYIWNQENKKIYLIFLTNAKTLRLQFSDNVGANYKLALKVMKTVYTITSILLQFRKNNHF